MKTAVIDVGGGMRDIYGAGVFDYCLDQGICFDVLYGISAGSANISSFLAGQHGRNYRFYMDYAFREEYMSWKNFFRTGNFLNFDYIYGDLSSASGEYPLDFEAMKNSGKQFVIVVTNAETGRPEYFTMEDMEQDRYDPIKASSCVPVLDKPYPIGEGRYFDGGITDPIPIRRAMKEGCDRIVLILTRPKDYFREAKNDLWLARALQRTYPNAAKALYRRSSYYNRSLSIALQMEKEGSVLILAPDSIEGMKTLSRDKDVMEELYRKGLADAEAIPAFLEGKAQE